MTRIKKILNNRDTAETRKHQNMLHASAVPTALGKCKQKCYSCKIPLSACLTYITLKKRQLVEQ